MKASDTIWILRRGGHIETSRIVKVGSKWVYFGWKEKFHIEDMNVRDYNDNYSGKVFLSEQALTEHVEAAEVAKAIYKIVADYSFKPEKYSLENLKQIKTLLESTNEQAQS